MKPYVKPIFNIAGAVANPNPGNSCTTSQEDLTMILNILGLTWADVSNPKMFAPSEPCEEKTILDFACKFTSISPEGTAGIMAFIS